MALPVLQLSGSPYTQGQQHGEELRERIAVNLQVYFERFERHGRLSRGEVLARAARYLKAIASQNENYCAALHGIADASGFDITDLTALNVRYEILYHQFSTNAVSDGCTAFALLPDKSQNRHLILGQNWDWIPNVQGAVLHTTEENGLETVSFTEAGVVGGKIGLNSVGLGLLITGLTSTNNDWSRLTKPFHVRCYEILRSLRLNEAVHVVTGETRACSANFLIAQAPNYVIDIEATPHKVHLVACENGCLVHTNHFLDPDVLDVTDPFAQWRGYSRGRRSRFEKLLQSKRCHSIEDIEGYLRDHEGFPLAVCCHEDPNERPEEQYITVTSVIMDLHERLLQLTDGFPCENTYEKLNLC